MNTERKRDMLQEHFNAVPSREEDVIRHFSRSFSSASAFLPVGVRGDVRKLYAWCRWCDEAVDSAHDIAMAQTHVRTLQEDVERIYRGEATHHPASRWLADLVDRYSIDQAYPSGLLTGMAMDLEPDQPQSESELINYCYHVAGVVGLMLCPILGADDGRARRHAEALGIAMQLTNIARDIREDATRGRCYLPKSWVPKGVDGSTDEELSDAVRRLLRLAERYYQLGDDGMQYLPSNSRRAIRIASAVYRDIGRQIEKSGCKVRDERTVTPWFRFVRIVSTAWLKDFFSVRFRSRNSFLLQGFTRMNDQRLNDAKYVVYLGISLTAFTSSAAFVLMMINPKDASYSVLPLVYAAVCLLTGVLAHGLAKKAETFGSVSDQSDAGHSS